MDCNPMMLTLNIKQIQSGVYTEVDVSCVHFFCCFFLGLQGDCVIELCCNGAVGSDTGSISYALSQEMELTEFCQLCYHICDSGKSITIE